MTAVDYILEGLRRELELERELGVRSVACDRALLAVSAKSESKSKVEVEERNDKNSTVQPSTSNVRRSFSEGGNLQSESQPQPSTSTCEIAFLHDRPLSAGGVEMMAKIMTALELDASTSPIVVEPPVPKAKVYVVLGALALRRFFPELRGAPGEWLSAGKGAEALVTYSPEYILRFKTVTPAVKKIKLEMWTCLKDVVRRLGKN